MSTETIGKSETGEMGERRYTGEMHAMDATGDTKIIWDRNNADEVENARRSFNDLKAKGHMAYKVEGKEGRKGEVIREFDPDAERIILSPQMRGG